MKSTKELEGYVVLFLNGSRLTSEIMVVAISQAVLRRIQAVVLLVTMLEVALGG